MRDYESYIQRGKAQYGEKFSDSALVPQFISAYNSQHRITVKFRSSNTGKVIDVRRGTVGITTGWIPCFLLMGRVSDHGSSYTLNAQDEIGTIEDWREWNKAQQA